MSWDWTAWLGAAAIALIVATIAIVIWVVRDLRRR